MDGMDGWDGSPGGPRYRAPTVLIKKEKRKDQQVPIEGKFFRARCENLRLCFALNNNIACPY